MLQVAVITRVNCCVLRLFFSFHVFLSQRVRSKPQLYAEYFLPGYSDICWSLRNR